MNVLLIEDETAVRNTAVDWLEVSFDEKNIKATVYEAHDDISAMEMIKSKNIDVVLLDMILKGNGGNVNIDKLINDIKGYSSDIRVIAVSGYVDDRKVVESAQKNKKLDCLMTKPVNYDALTDLLVGKNG